MTVRNHNFAKSTEGSGQDARDDNKAFSSFK